MKQANELLRRLSNFLARLPGLPILIAVALILLNFVLQLLPDWPLIGWLAQTHFCMHLGLILGLLGILLGDAL
ncbi:MAG: hypothetical protein PVI07_01640 [Anaerolineae bacterium]|jgi:hypothetical protein